MRYGFVPNQIDNVLYDAFGQRTVSTIYNPFNQYFVVMEVAPKYWQYPQMLDRTYFSTAAGNPSGGPADPGAARHRECGGAVRRRSHRARHGVHQLEQRQRRGQRGH